MLVGVSECRQYMGKRGKRQDRVKALRGEFSHSLAATASMPTNFLQSNDESTAIIPAPNIAGYWSQRHLSPSWPPKVRSAMFTRRGPVVPKVAVLITGLLRVQSEEHVNTVLNATAG